MEDKTLSNAYEFEVITLAVAEHAPIAIVSISFSGRLSWLYHWDTDNDVITQGQCLKGRSQIYDISPDGKYFLYYAESFHRQAKSYFAIAKPPYFTALAFFPTFHLGPRFGKFLDNKTVEIGTDSPGWWGDFASREDRIDPGCPLNILLVEKGFSWGQTEDRDEMHKRRVWSQKRKLYSLQDGADEPVLIQEFRRQQLTPLPSPEWAKTW